jgi:hypothetical protein
MQRSTIDGKVAIVGHGSTVVADSKVEVSGSFRLRDVTSSPSHVTVLLVGVEPDGKEIITYSGIAKKEAPTDGLVRFECEVQTPATPGKYKLRAWYEDHAFAESEVEVE